MRRLQKMQLARRIMSRLHILPLISPPTCVATRGHTNSVRSVAFHPNQPLQATGSFDNTVRLWDCSYPKKIIK